MNQEICPITGCPCNKSKYIHLTTVGKDGTIEETNLCQDCGMGTYSLDKKEIEKNHEVPIDNIVNIVQALMGNSIPINKEVIIPRKILNESKCPNCGVTLKEIGKMSKLGCAKCYEYFKKELMPVLIHAQKSLKHKGKVPKQWLKNKEEEKKNLPEDIEKLELMLKKAVKNEEYENAAKIRDKINNIKSS